MSLEAQVLAPITSRLEMDLPLEDAVERLRTIREYRDGCAAAFGSDIGAATLARALASYVRTIVSADSPFDRHMSGDENAMTAPAREGLALFRGRAGCANCHHGPLLSDETFHNTGVAWVDGSWRDLGRAAVTGSPADAGAFKAPTLREVARTAPYMHDGSLPTLEAVVEFYAGGGGANPRLDPRLRPLLLTARERSALVAFLRSLSGRISEGRLWPGSADPSRVHAPVVR